MTTVQTDLHGKVALVTGATSGIGEVTARELARAGATVVLLARDADKARTVAESIKRDTGNASVEVLIADLGVQAQVREAARQFLQGHDRLDILVNNAGAVNTRRTETPDGVETTWAVNHLAPFLLTNELLDLLKGTPGARVVNVSSDAHRGARINWDDVEGKRSYSAFGAYGQSKLANILFTRELARRLRGSGVTVNAAHPGFVSTGFGKNDGGPIAFLVGLASPLARSPERGAQTSLYLATSPEPVGVSGRYFADEREVQPSPQALDDGAADRLWRLSEQMVGEQMVGEQMVEGGVPA